MLTISNDAGDTLRQAALREIPYQVKFSERKQDNRSKLVEGTVSLLLSKRTLFMYSIEDPDNPIELAFQPKYGDVVAYDWLVLTLLQLIKLRFLCKYYLN